MQGKTWICAFKANLPDVTNPKKLIVAKSHMAYTYLCEEGGGRTVHKQEMASRCLPTPVHNSTATNQWCQV